MGLDASVRCRCFEEGKFRPGPVPFGDLFIDEDGYIWSKKLAAAYKKYNYRQYQARYGTLDHDFDCWSDNCCEHEEGCSCIVWVSNWAGCAKFESLVAEMGGEDVFPLLSNFLPDANGGCYPAELAAATLEELDSFVARVSDVDEWALCELDSEDVVWSSTDNSAFTWMYAYDCRIGMVGDKVFFVGPGDFYAETAHFKQIPLGEPDSKGMQRMRIIFLDREGEVEIFDSIGPQDAPKIEREFYITSKKAPFLYEGKYGTAERIRVLLEASIETGNPIRWC
jgi:hypothetical protein